VKGRFAQRGPLRAGTFCRWCRPFTPAQLDDGLPARRKTLVAN